MSPYMYFIAPAKRKRRVTFAGCGGINGGISGVIIGDERIFSDLVARAMGRGRNGKRYRNQARGFEQCV